jgi:hypothetical protein
MANQHKHRARGLRGIDDELWDEFAIAATTAGTDRSTAVREFIEWYVGRDSAELPARPARPAK